MSITQTNTIAKIAAVVAGLGLVAMTFVAAAPAKAADTMFNVNLTVGSKGADVTALQNWLIAKGYSIPAGATGYFGGQTKAAVAAYQATNMISPAAGYFGPLTRASVNAGGSSTGGTTTGGSTSSLKGGAGSLKNVSSLGDVESDLKEGDGATKVVGFEAEAKDSDVAVQRVDVTMTIANSGGSSSLNKYVDTVALYQDGKKLASMNASAGDKDGRVWTFRFSDVNGVIREGDTSNFYVEVTPVSSIGTDEAGDTVTATISTDGIRAVDAEGVSETYGTSNFATNGFSVSTATDGTLTINEGSDNPKSTTVKTDLNNTTDGIVLSSFNLKAKNQDVTVHDLPVTIVSNGAVNDYVQSVKLVSNGKTLKTKTVSSTASSTTLTFDSIDQTIDKDSTQNFQVVATIKKIDGSNSFTSGDTLYATTSNSAAWDVEDANGSTVAPSGSLTGNTMTFQATGITVTKVSADATKTVGTTAGSGDSTQYSISFKVTAGDDDLYIGRTITRLATAATTPSASAGGVSWATTTSSTQGVTSSTIGTSLAAGDTNSSDATGYYKVPAGSSRTFTLNVTMNATSTGYTGVQIVGINYSTTSTLGTTYFTSGLDTFKTNDVSMTTH